MDIKIPERVLSVFPINLGYSCKSRSWRRLGRRRVRHFLPAECCAGCLPSRRHGPITAWPVIGGHLPGVWSSRTTQCSPWFLSNAIGVRRVVPSTYIGRPVGHGSAGSPNLGGQTTSEWSTTRSYTCGGCELCYSIALYSDLVTDLRLQLRTTPTQTSIFTYFIVLVGNWNEII